MPTYVVLYRFSDQGLKTIKDTVKRAAEIRRQNEQRGFKVIGTYWTQGAYDLVAIVDAPDEQARKLSRMFADNFLQYAGRVSKEIEEAGPPA